jgi:hypothetical protein
MVSHRVLNRNKWSSRWLSGCKDTVRQESWRVPAGGSPARIRGSARPVASVASWKVTTTTSVYSNLVGCEVEPRKSRCRRGRGARIRRSFHLLASCARKTHIARASELLAVTPPPEPVEVPEPLDWLPVQCEGSGTGASMHQCRYQALIPHPIGSHYGLSLAA